MTSVDGGGGGGPLEKNQGTKVGANVGADVVGKRRSVRAAAAGTSSAAPAPIICVDTETYDKQLGDKVERVRTQFADFFSGELEVFRSKKKHYRMRSEFRIWHDYEQGTEKDLYYVMFQGGGHDQKRFRVDDFDVGSELLNRLMRKIIEGVRGNEVLSKKIFQANFHTTLSGQAMVSLLYHRKLDEEWKAEAEKLRQQLATAEGLEEGHVPSLIGRSRKQKEVLGVDHVTETLRVCGRDLSYRQLEGNFSQPNGGMCINMLEWAVKHTRPEGGEPKDDLLELYCGNGNFSIAMAENFRRCVGTEISKRSVAAAQHNIKANGVENVVIARCGSEEFSAALLSDKMKSFKRFEQQGLDLSECDFGTVLVDPPRAGLDDDTVKLVSKFGTIVYISCNPDTLCENVKALSETHDVAHFALFDQFPYSHHVECGVVMRKRAKGKRAREAGGAGEEEDAAKAKK